MPQTARFREAASARPRSIDRENKVIRGVRILGLSSRNKRRYPESVVKEAVAKYEGARVNVDHPSRDDHGADRGMTEGFGWLQNVHFAGGDGAGLFGDLHYYEAHPAKDLVLERAERRPDSFGLSHVIDGGLKYEGEEAVVESIAQVVSVDIVSDPATTGGLFESFEVVSMPETVTENLADAGVDDMAPDTAANVARTAFRNMVIGVFDDESLDDKQTLQLIKDIIKRREQFLEQLEGKSEEPPEPEPEEEPEEMASPEESELLAVEMTELKAKNLLLESRRKATPERIKAIAAVDEDTQKALVESWQEDLVGEPIREDYPKPDLGRRDSQDTDKYAQSWATLLESANKT